MLKGRAKFCSFDNFTQKKIDFDKSCLPFNLITDFYSF